MIVFIQTDFPDPVEPAIIRCGIFARSATTTCPDISLPSANVIGEFLVLNSVDSTKSLNGTVTFLLFGTSIPTADFPGIGASILTSVAASANLMSSASPTILLTFTPSSG